jgi:hypothetical protein
VHLITFFIFALNALITSHFSDSTTENPSVVIPMNFSNGKLSFSKILKTEFPIK